MSAAAGPAPAGPAVVAVVGSVNRDLVSFVPHLPAPGETVLADRTTTGAGGKGSNQAVAAARHSREARMLACVGEDDDGRAALAALAEAGVRVDGVVRTEEAPTGRAFVTVDAAGRNAIVVAPGANLLLGPTTVASALAEVAGPGAVLVVQAEVPVPTIEAALAVAAAGRARSVVNLAPFVDVDAALLATSDPLVVNESEVGQLLGRPVDGVPDVVRAAEELLGRVRSCVVTLGGAGAVAVEPDMLVHVPAPEVPVVDTTGAGDALVGVLAARLAAGDPLVDALRWGVCAASLSVGGEGAQASYPHEEAVAAALGGVPAHVLSNR